MSEVDFLSIAKALKTKIDWLEQTLTAIEQRLVLCEQDSQSADNDEQTKQPVAISYTTSDMELWKRILDEGYANGVQRSPLAPELVALVANGNRILQRPIKSLTDAGVAGIASARVSLAWDSEFLTAFLRYHDVYELYRTAHTDPAVLDAYPSYKKFLETLGDK